MSSDSTPRYLVRCDSGMHRVPLDGEHYWRTARCPSCRTRMDRRRVRRVRQWLLGNAPRATARLGSRLRLVPIELFALLFLALIASGTLVLHTLADAWWPATVLLFFARWPWLVPGLPVLLLAIGLGHARAIAITVVAAVIGLFGILDLSLGTARFVRAESVASQVRIITYNIGGTMAAPMSLVSMVSVWEPDIVAIQECNETSVEALRGLPNYRHDLGDTCLFTRFEIVRVDSLRQDSLRTVRGAGWLRRYRLKGPDGEFDFTNVHLESPRAGFAAMLSGTSDGTGSVAEKTTMRERESRVARRFADLGPGPRLVAGDFNMPTESAIYRRHWNGLANGFDVAGLGFGYSRRAGLIQLRIDHVLADDRWVVQHARLLPDYGSDHRPMLVDVALREK